jgi:diguanylate cyclase (GGDEF)-like protein
MDEKALPHFASRFQTVGAWREAMLALGYTMPLQLCHGLSQAMTHLKLTFPAAFRLLWDNQKIIVAGLSLIYANSASKLWAEDKRPPSAPPASPTQPAVARDRDVLALVPPTEDMVRLESLWSLASDSSPLMKLALWQPGDEDEELLREFLLDFGHEVAATAWKSTGRQDDLCDEQTYAKLKDRVFKDEATGLCNHRFFSHRLSGEISCHQRFNYPVSVALLRVDGLGRLSDELGRAAGDETARAVAEVLVRHTRPGNVVCRYRRELFAVVMVGTSIEGARLYLHRIRYVLSRARFKHSNRVTARFGRAGLPDCKAVVAEDLFRQAEESLRATRREPERKRAKPNGSDEQQLNLGGW